MLNNLKGKKVLVRVDFNVPLDKDFNVTDETRLLKAIPTIDDILAQGASVILMSHLGRPLKKLKDDGSINVSKFTLRHIIPNLSKLLKRPIIFAHDTVGKDAFDKANVLKLGEVLLLENTRFNKEEAEGDRDFAAKLAKLADVYINDAFGTAHRAHASTTTVAKFFEPEDKSFGYLIENELKFASKLLNSPKRPFVAILGGAKVSDKIKLIEKLIDVANFILIGGGMSYTFTKALGGNIGKSLVEDDQLDLALELISKAKDQNVEIVLPEDTVVADKFSADADFKITDSYHIDNDWMGLDIGPKAIEKFSNIILDAQSILWNGPVGVFEFENFSKGTFAIAEAVAKATKKGAFSLIGGGDSVAAINKSGLGDQVSFISTGGGAMLEYLEGKSLPGLKAIEG
ncbi:MAG: phosphoglycerate kinase [Saprospiraceae bacterium]|nr:phosphoglycerate kinase [Bacteroidia bacterium]NNE14952.1 phosphoglycerate kinase [Saprospiraceae bacterium]NNL92434.1 phosphoglycerate kinase [Saprospiraceae bacterium]